MRTILFAMTAFPPSSRRCKNGVFGITAGVGAADGGIAAGVGAADAGLRAAVAPSGLPGPRVASVVRASAPLCLLKVNEWERGGCQNQNTKPYTLNPQPSTLNPQPPEPKTPRRPACP